MNKQAKLLLSGLALLGTQALIPQAQAADLLGRWDLDGDGTPESVFRESGKIQVKSAGGSLLRTYDLGNTTWELRFAANTDSRPGAELIVKAGPDLAIISMVENAVRKYPVGNKVWNVVGTAQLDNNPGEEVIALTGAEAIIVSHHLKEQVTLSDFMVGGWHYYGPFNIGGLPYGTLSFTTGNGILLYDFQTRLKRTTFTNGATATIAAAEVNGVPGNELIARDNNDLIIYTGTVAAGQFQNYTQGSGSNWATYAGFVDTNGKPGADVIINKLDRITILHPADNTQKDYPINSTEYSILSVSDQDGQPGAEITLIDKSNRTYVINDRLGTIQPL
ncbi:hypothetical protein SZ55_0330 [Pseudomonas sp. FeS53a]|uniref:hypothetical protein n=1 Tax=Pseudomonas sp. FeS53a TaxID=1604022 RepID=UPI0005C86C0A|nr:hypothetical protein [Pseudomonas sp. FeS53a]KIV74761.1 hypothetical protein SZ55_0330 [Pseudomonas sp. FeS53a]